MYKIMIIEDDSDFIESIKDNFEFEENYTFSSHTNSETALIELKKEHFDLILLDYFLIGENAEGVLKKIRKINENIFICLLTAYSEEITSTNAFKIDVQGYIDKGSAFNTIINSIKSILHSSIKSQKISKNTDNKETFGVRLKKLREKYKYSQQDIANKLGLKRATISTYEVDKAEPSFEVLKQLATIFNTSTDYLIGRIKE